uniref:Uncharacterized protein n=1 Tax=Euplotes harpa TaxID=151035 RepID=A0A7S3NB61_9SPIT|mmetsp:Transcript_26544/g.30664  ORF Transcript_26544/g.30664 Transcript_26544/m.30664 type:complete len:165 (+) Transcript_26544:89-583(+)
MWSNMVRKAPSKPCKEEAKAEIQEEDAEDNIVGPPQEDVEDKKAEGAEEDTDGKQDGEEQNEEKQAATDHVYLDPLNPVLPIPDYAKTAHGTSPNDFEKEERNLEELGSLMTQIKNLKENIQDMSMEDRRKNAEQMIMKIAGFMNLDDDIDFSDEEDYDKDVNV